MVLSLGASVESSRTVGQYAYDSWVSVAFLVQHHV